MGLLLLGLRPGFTPFRVSGFLQACPSLLLGFRGRLTPFKFQGFRIGPFCRRASVWEDSFSGFGLGLLLLGFRGSRILVEGLGSL